MDLERERGITIKAHAVRLNYKAEDGEHVSAQPDRHARPRRFHLRSFAQPAGVRRRAAGGRRLAGRRGADARQHLPGAATTTSKSSRSSTRSICRPPSPSASASRSRQVIGLDASDAVLASAKQGIGIDEMLEAVVHRVPPPKGDPGCAAARADFRFLVRSLSRRDHSDCASSKAGCGWARRSGCGPTGSIYEVEGLGYQSPKADPLRRAVGGRSRASCSPTSRPSPTRKIGDTITDPSNPAAEPLPGFRGNQADGVRRALSGGIARARPAARCARKASAERQRLQLRAGELGGAGLRLPLRIPGPAAPGDRAGAPGARVQYRPDHHRARRALPHHADRTAK